MSSNKTNPVPAIEPPCQDCVAAQAQSGDPKAECQLHAEKHAAGHAYGYRREIPMVPHDSNVVPTGVRDPGRGI